jgi:hypothetical protein
MQKIASDMIEPHARTSMIHAPVVMEALRDGSLDRSETNPAVLRELGLLSIAAAISGMAARPLLKTCDGLAPPHPYRLHPTGMRA